MKILVTGSMGFIGKKLATHIAEYTDHEVVGLHYKSINEQLPFETLNCDLREELAVRSMLRKIKPDVICHLAGNAVPIPDLKDPDAILLSNVLSTNHLLAHSRKNTRFIFASSILVYGETWTPPIETRYVYPTSIYGATKIASEALISSYLSCGQISQGLSLRFCAVVGPGATHGMLKAVVEKLRSKSSELELFGEAPGSAKPSLHIDDAVAAFMYGIDNHKLCGPFNVCGEGNMSVQETAKLAMQTLKIEKPLKWLGKKTVWPGDTDRLLASNDASKIVGFQYKYPLSLNAVHAALLDYKDENSLSKTNTTCEIS